GQAFAKPRCRHRDEVRRGRRHRHLLDQVDRMCIDGCFLFGHCYFLYDEGGGQPATWSASSSARLIPRGAANMSTWLGCSTESWPSTTQNGVRMNLAVSGSLTLTSGLMSIRPSSYSSTTLTVISALHLSAGHSSSAISASCICSSR